MPTTRDQKNPVTDHALLRYLQREKGIDVEAIRNEMATDIVRAACQAGARTVKIGSLEFRIDKFGSVRTVIDNRKSKGHKTRLGDGKKINRGARKCRERQRR